MKQDRRLRKIAAEAYERLLARGQGRVSLDEIVEEIARELHAAGLDEDLLHDIATDAAKSEDDRRTAQARSGQIDILTGDDEALDGVWSVGGGARVRVRTARRDDYLTHLSLQGENAARITEAYARAQRDAAKLLPYMTDASITVEEAIRAWQQAQSGGDS